jgi:hypothetical protein
MDKPFEVALCFCLQGSIQEQYFLGNTLKGCNLYTNLHGVTYKKTGMFNVHVSYRSLDALGSNFVSLESPELVANGVLNFACDGIGHEVADSCMEELRTNFRGDIWVHNGPDLVSRVLLKICNCSSVSHRAVWY